MAPSFLASGGRRQVCRFMTGRARWNVSLILHIYVTYPWGKELTDSISTGRGETVKVIGGILPLCQFSLVTSGAQGFPLDISHLPPWGWSVNSCRIEPGAGQIEQKPSVFLFFFSGENSNHLSRATNPGGVLGSSKAHTHFLYSSTSSRAAGSNW